MDSVGVALAVVPHTAAVEMVHSSCQVLLVVDSEVEVGQSCCKIAVAVLPLTLVGQGLP